MPLVGRLAGTLALRTTVQKPNGWNAPASNLRRLRPKKLRHCRAAASSRGSCVNLGYIQLHRQVILGLCLLTECGTIMIPNLVTASRLVLLLPLMLLLAYGRAPGTRWLAFGLFVFAGLTDFLDGWLARRLKCVSAVGTFFDPLVDKIFANVLLLFLALWYPAWVPPWLVLLILVREFAVQGFRSMAPCKGVLLRTRLVSKLKLVFQLICVGTALAGLAWTSAAPVLQKVAWTSLGLACAAAYASMFTLLRNNRDLWNRPAVELETR